jgi:glycosyltransferase involved in cell wall biosynthesis
MKVLVRGPALTRTGYGEHCRFVLRALRQLENLDIYLIPVNWGQSNWIWEDNEERQWVDDIVRKTALYGQQKGEYDMSIQVTIPNEWQRLAPVNIGVTAGIETTKTAPVWLEKANGMDKVITVSEHSKQTFLNTVYEGTDKRTGQRAFLKCLKDVEVIHYPVKNVKKTELKLDMSTKFNFLTVAQWGPRKNIENTICWFVEEFIDNPDVGLVIKTFAKGGSILDRVNARKQLGNILRKYNNRQCKVYLLHGDMSDQEMHSLYRDKNIHCLVSLTHGEGFGLPLFEAAYSGLPVLATDWSGHLDYLYMPIVDKKGKEKLRPHFARVDYSLQPVQPNVVWEGVIQQDSMWAFAQQGSYKMKLREVYKDHGRFKSQAKKLQKWILKNFKEDEQYEKFNNVIKDYIFDDWNIDDWYNELNDSAQ